MNWHDDPILAKERYHAGVRGKLLRSTLIWVMRVFLKMKT